jgi:hypothetical protein
MHARPPGPRRAWPRPASTPCRNARTHPIVNTPCAVLRFGDLFCWLVGRVLVLAASMFSVRVSVRACVCVRRVWRARTTRRWCVVVVAAATTNAACAPRRYQHVANFTRHRSPRRLAAGLDAMWKMSSDDADGSSGAGGADGGDGGGDGGQGPGGGGAGADGAGGGAETGGAGGNAASSSSSTSSSSSASSAASSAASGPPQPRTYRALIEARANEAWDIIKGCVHY